MNYCIRAIAVSVCVALVFSFSACGSKNKRKSTVSSSASVVSSAASTFNSSEQFSLPVTLSKSLNPLTTDSMTNLVLWPLMYDCLSEPDQNYTTSLGLATSIDNNGVTVLAHLRSNILFTDGSPLTAKDVVDSYHMVMKTQGSFFYSNTSNISSVEQSDSSTVIFHLFSPDPLFSNLLDIPIIKSGTDLNNNKYSATGINVPPTGSGRYVFSTNSFSGTLTCNKNWYNAGATNFKTINLVNMLNGSATFSSLKIGGINCMFTDYGNGTLASAGLNTAPVYLNRMVFLGVNSQRPGLSNSKVRNAISLAIDRKTIVSNSFSSRAAATNIPFNPRWAGVAKPDNKQISPDYTLAQSELAGEGFSVKNYAGALSGNIDGTAVTLSYKLLVDKDNTIGVTAAKEIIADLNKVGVIVSLDAEPSDVFDTKIAQNEFDLYLGQINISDNMDITPLLSGGTAVNYTPQTQATLNAFNSWRSGAVNISSVVKVFNDETPFIPVCYRYGSISFTKGLTGTIEPTYYDIFRGIYGWHY